MEDTYVEGTESFHLILSNPTETGYLGQISEMALSIQDNDSSVAFDSATASAVEGQSIELTLTRLGEMSEQAQVDYSVTGSTATASDLDLAGGTVMFESGESSKSISIDTYEDN